MYLSIVVKRPEFLLRQGDCVKKGLHRGLAEAPAALMWATIIVFDQPGVEVGLQLVNGVIDLLAERDPVELVQDSAMGSARRFRSFVGSWSWCGCDRCPRPRDRARNRGSGCRKTRCRDRSARAIAGCRVRRRTAPPGH